MAGACNCSTTKVSSPQPSQTTASLTVRPAAAIREDCNHLLSVVHKPTCCNVEPAAAACAKRNGAAAKRSGQPPSAMGQPQRAVQAPLPAPVQEQFTTVVRAGRGGSSTNRVEQARLDVEAELAVRCEAQVTADWMQTLIFQVAPLPMHNFEANYEDSQ
eukprot:TRINITY_DN15359_c0_g1_i3.p1 TRINITY_DN15359_c0_g1~~TRINITY_DN15359_c0_g1_i3.p1  ORF type:complete len:159 (-),score=11.57 TRINITY_DN15359_c0_g1_i3:251-727(-)